RSESKGSYRALRLASLAQGENGKKKPAVSRSRGPQGSESLSEDGVGDGHHVAAGRFVAGNELDGVRRRRVDPGGRRLRDPVDEHLEARELGDLGQREVVAGRRHLEREVLQ